MGAQAVCLLRNLLKLLLETSGCLRPDAAGDLCSMSDQIKCRPLAMLNKSYSYSSFVRDWILFFRLLLPFPAFMLLLGLICGWGCQGAGGLGQTMLSCGTMLFSHLLTACLLRRACRHQYLVVLFLLLSAVQKAKSWLESKVLYIAKGCAPFILRMG